MWRRNLRSELDDGRRELCGSASAATSANEESVGRLAAVAEVIGPPVGKDATCAKLNGTQAVRAQLTRAVELANAGKLNQ